MPSKDSPHTSLLPTFVASLLVLFFGSGVFFYSTNQGQAVTTEALRQAELVDHPKRIPPLEIIDSSHPTAQLLTEALSRDSRVKIVDFVYTRCQTVCVSLGSSFQNLQTLILQMGLENKIALVSISFDPEYDDAAALSRYQQRLQMNPLVWQVYSLKHSKDRQQLLDTFGIMVIPAPLDEFEHNAAFHLVHRQHLYRIIELDQDLEAIDQALAIGQIK